MLHVIYTQLCPGHWSVRVGDSSPCSKGIIKKIELRLFNAIVIVVDVVLLSLLLVVVMVVFRFFVCLFCFCFLVCFFCFVFFLRDWSSREWMFP